MSSTGNILPLSVRHRKGIVSATGEDIEADDKKKRHGNSHPVRLYKLCLRVLFVLLILLFAIPLVGYLVLRFNVRIHLPCEHLVEGCRPHLSKLRSQYEEAFFGHLSGNQQTYNEKLTSFRKVSVVVMNWDRPDTLRDAVIPALLASPRVSEVIVSHGKPDTAEALTRDVRHPRVIHVSKFEANKKIGVASRFETAIEHASEEWVIFMDDDIIPSENAMEELLREFARNPNRIVGKWGRHQHFWPFYDTVDVDGNCEVVLTKFMIMKHSTISLFFQYAHLLGLPRGLSPHSVKPVWNGEDIFMSLIHSDAALSSLAGNGKNFAILNLSGVSDGGMEEKNNNDQQKKAISSNIPKDWTAIFHFLPRPIGSGRGFSAMKHWWHRTKLWFLITARLERLHLLDQ
eukprot:g1471.t1